MPIKNDFQITHIGIKENRESGFRYKRLHNSGIFRGNDTRQKLIDCQGPFEEWTNIAARNWIFARVKELKEGRKVHLVCDCCGLNQSSSKVVVSRGNPSARLMLIGEAPGAREDALGAPYPGIGGPDWTQIQIDAAKMPFVEFADQFWKN